MKVIIMNRINLQILKYIIATFSFTIILASIASAIDYPTLTTPGPASIQIEPSRIIVQNNVILLKLDTTGDSLRLIQINNKHTNSTF